METSVLSLSEIHSRVPSAASKYCCGINIAAYQNKITGGRYAGPYLRSSFKVPFSAERHGSLPYKRTQPRVHIARATSGQDEGEEGTESKNGVFQNSIGKIFDLFGCIFKVGLGILSQMKQEYEKLEDVIGEVADDVQQVAKLTEEMAEKVLGESAKDGMMYRSAVLVDKISEIVAKNAEIVENQTERIEETLRAIDNAVGDAEDVVEGFAKGVSTVGKDHDSSIVGEKSSTQTVEVKNG